MSAEVDPMQTPNLAVEKCEGGGSVGDNDDDDDNK